MSEKKSWPLCDKCGKPVHPRNNVYYIDLAAFPNPIVELVVAFTGVPGRHFLPVDGCEGSPSRAQYIEGQPRDTRGYGYHKEEYEQAYRAGYAAVQQACDEEGL